MLHNLTTKKDIRSFAITPENPTGEKENTAYLDFSSVLKDLIRVLSELFYILLCERSVAYFSCRRGSHHRRYVAFRLYLLRRF